MGSLSRAHETCHGRNKLWRRKAASTCHHDESGRSSMAKMAMARLRATPNQGQSANRPALAQFPLPTAHRFHLHLPLALYAHPQ